MFIERIALPAGKLLDRHRMLALGLVVLSAYAAAAPATETFGSHNLERVKDLTALAFAGIGLALRCIASTSRPDRRDLDSPLYLANVLILFGIFLMHGNAYVLVFGLTACVAILQIVAHATGRTLLDFRWASLADDQKPLLMRLRGGLAKEWLTITLTLCLLALTEVYEDLSGGTATSLHHILLALSGGLMLISAVALLVQLRQTSQFAPAARSAGSIPATFGGGLADKHPRRSRIRLSKETADALLIPWARGFFWLAASALQVRTPYHPVQIVGGRSGKRETEARWEAIATVIKSYGARSILDVGCAEGWFLRRAAKTFDCFGLGIDSYESRVMLGEAARLHAGDERVAIMKGKLTPDDVRDLPSCDVVMCLSVLHWVIRREGLSFAQDFVRALASRTGKALIFEIGSAETFAQKFARLLPPNATGEDFVRYLLASGGVENVRVIASSPDINNIWSRTLFVGEPARPGTAH